MGGQGTSASRPARRTDIREDNMDDKIDAQQSAARATATPLVDGSPTDPTAAAHAGHDDIVYPASIPFVLMHVAGLAAIWTGITWQAVIMFVVLYWLRMFAIGAGYHRYFAHRSYSTGRAFQFVLAVMAQSSAQKSILWWAAMHRHHHLHSDTVDDVHSPRRHGFVYSHLGWIFARSHNTTDLVKIADFARYPELMWLHRCELVPAIVLGLLCFLVGGWPGLVVGFVWSTLLLYHATFCINSLAHVLGRQRYVTGDDSRNNWLLALFTMGEGWHNNHHAYQSSVRQGFRRGEIDATFYILKMLSRTGLIWDLKMPPNSVLRNEYRLGARVIARAAAQLVASFNPEHIAATIRLALESSRVSTLQELQDRLASTQQRAADVLAGLHAPHLPTRNEILARATAMFARTPSLDDIVDRAHALILEAIGSRLCAGTPGRS
jgi:stearoyl-CoA desaturase (Delta-9 desaturase)